MLWYFPINSFKKVFTEFSRNIIQRINQTAQFEGRVLTRLLLFPTAAIRSGSLGPRISDWLATNLGAPPRLFRFDNWQDNSQNSEIRTSQKRRCIVLSLGGFQIQSPHVLSMYYPVGMDVWQYVQSTDNLGSSFKLQCPEIFIRVLLCRHNLLNHCLCHWTWSLVTLLSPGLTDMLWLHPLISGLVFLEWPAPILSHLISINYQVWS